MDEFIAILREVRDPRDFSARHQVGEVLFLALCASLCGAQTGVDRAEFAAAHEQDFRGVLRLRHGVPSHDTFSRLFRILDPAELHKAFDLFLAALRRDLGLPASGRVVAIDGKSLRRGYEAGRAHMPPLMVSVWDAETRLALAQGLAPGNGEVAGTLKLLRGLALKGAMVTADALHCHPAMAAAVRARGAHYALGLKGNRSALLAAAEAAFAGAGGAPARYETREEGHGRRERREACVVKAAALARPHGFPGLAALGRIRAERTLKDRRAQTSTRYVVLSRVLSPRRLLQVARAHWSIENHLHWTLDVVFDEDQARSRKNHAPENLAILRRLAQNIWRAHPDTRPIGRKMKLASWSKDYFFSAFAHLQ